MSLVVKLKGLLIKYPLFRGMIAYGVLWPTGSLIQQSIEGRRPGNYDWKRCIRFGLFGGLFVAPTLFVWFKLTSAMWPKTNFKSGITKALVDQMSYGPFSNVSFYIGMSLLEGKTMPEAVDELKQKFLPTYKVAFCFWPIIQTINYSMLPERNRVVFTSFISVIWTTFLAYMKEKKNLKQKQIEKLKNMKD